MERIFVTGGAGFIGGHAVKALIEKGNQVVVFDSFVTGKRENVPEGVEIVEGDARDIEAISSAMKGATKVVHLAALVSVAESMERPLETHGVNVTGTANVFEAARSAGVVRIVYASSAAVYGDDPVLPKQEGTALAPKSPYALSKLLDEHIADGYERIYGHSSAGLRFFNVYGPGQTGNHPYASVIPRWIECVRQGESCTVFGDGSQTRDFVHVTDVAAAIHAALDSDATGVFNIASGIETPLTDFQKILQETFGDKALFRHVPARAGDIARSVADVSRAQKELGFLAQVSFAEGVNQLLS